MIEMNDFSLDDLNLMKKPSLLNSSSKSSDHNKELVARDSLGSLSSVLRSALLQTKDTDAELGVPATVLSNFKADITLSMLQQAQDSIS